VYSHKYNQPRCLAGHKFNHMKTKSIYKVVLYPEQSWEQKKTIITASKAEAETIAESAVNSFDAEYYSITEIKIS